MNTIKIICFIILFLYPFSAESITWHKKDIKTTVNLKSVYFLEDGNNGWITGDNGVIFYSANRGESWTKQNTGTSFSINSIYFETASTGCAVGNGGTLIYTSNGGKTWQKAESDVVTSLLSMSFSNKIGFAAGSNGTIITTKDFGKTWTSLNGPIESDIYGIYAKSSELWIIGESGSLYYSRDKGNKWTKVDLDITENLYDINFDGGSGYIVGSFGVIVKSNNSGKTWDLLPKDTAGTTLKKIYSFGDILCVIREDGKMAFSKDDGKTWDEESTNTTLPLYCGYFADWGAWFVGNEGAIVYASPVTTSLNLSSDVFSLGSTGGITCTTTIASEGTIDNVELLIKDNKDKTIKKLYKGKTNPKEVKWDGKDDKGKPIDEGNYSVYFAVTDTDGFESVETKTIKAKIIKPTIDISISQNVFSPHSNQTIKITMETNVEEEDIKMKLFEIHNEEGKVVRTFLNPTDTFIWQGKNDDGNLVLPGIYLLNSMILGRANSVLVESKNTIIVEPPLPTNKVLVVTLAKVNFDNGSSTLQSSYERELNRAVDLIKKYTRFYLQIKGYSDKVESRAKTEDDLLKLSIDRINSVLNFLLSKDQIDKQRIIKMPYGSTKSEKKDPNNRRVEVLLSSE